VDFIKTQLEADWRTPIMEMLDIISQRYEKREIAGTGKQEEE